MRLFCVPRDESRERWEGPRTGFDGAVKEFDADTADDISELPSHLYSLLNTSAQRPVYVDLPNKTWSRVGKAEAAKSMLDFFNEGSGSAPLDFLRLGRKKGDVDSVINLLLSRKGKSAYPLKSHIEKLRAVKSANELELMRKSAALSAHAHAEVRSTFARVKLLTRGFSA
jgi:intermediate cleaving peptidase 55